jgi:hypothetical protein
MHSKIVLHRGGTAWYLSVLVAWLWTVGAPPAAPAAEPPPGKTNRLGVYPDRHFVLKQSRDRAFGAFAALADGSKLVCACEGSVGLSITWATAGKISAEETVDTPQSDANVSTPLEIAPIIRMEKSANMVLRVRLTNRSGEPFRFFGGTRVPIGNLHFVLSKDGLRVPLLVTYTPPAATRNNVRALSPGQSFLYSICLNDYGVDGKADNLPAGRYELRVEYSMGEKAVFVQEMGLTPAEIDELVAMIELVDGDDPAGDAAGDGEAGIGIWIVVILMLAGAVLAVAWARRQRQQPERHGLQPRAQPAVPPAR